MLLMLGIVRILSRIDNLALDITDPVTIAAPHLYTWVGGVDVSCHATAYIAGGRNLEDHLTSTGITEVTTILAVLMAIPHLELGR